jgi:hypothetical protein
MAEPQITSFPTPADPEHVTLEAVVAEAVRLVQASPYVAANGIAVLTPDYPGRRDLPRFFPEVERLPAIRVNVAGMPCRRETEAFLSVDLMLEFELFWPGRHYADRSRMLEILKDILLPDDPRPADDPRSTATLQSYSPGTYDFSTLGDMIEFLPPDDYGLGTTARLRLSYFW